MRTYLQIRYRQLLATCQKLRRRLERSMNSGSFRKLPVCKRQYLLNRIARLHAKLAHLQHQLSLIASGSLLVAGLGTFVESQAQISAVPAGNPLQANTFITNNQVNSTIASDSDGDFVTVWQGNSQAGGNLYDIYLRRYTTTGTPLDAAGILVNTGFIAGNQISPDVAMDANGDFVVVWQSDGQDGSGNGIYAQRYNVEGIAQSVAVRVNNYTTSEQINPSIAMDADGDFIISWESNGQDGSGSGIYARRYNNAGVAQSINEFLVNTTTTGNQTAATVDMDRNGNFTIVWQSTDGIYARKYTNLGVADGIELQVNLSTGQLTPSVALTSLGNFVVTWTKTGQADAGDEIVGKRYVNNVAGTVFTVNTFTTGQQTDASVSADEKGNFVVTWQSTGQDGAEEGIYARRYSSAGIAQETSEFLINAAFTTGKQTRPAIAVDAIGNFLITWSSYGQIQTNSNEDIFVQRYTLPTLDQKVNPAGDRPIAAMDADGDYVLVWDEGTYGNRDIYAQRYAKSGIAQGTRFLVHSAPAGDQSSPAVAMDADGDFAVSWQVSGQIVYRKFNAAGTPQTADVTITSAGFSPAIAMDASGNIVIVWAANDHISGSRYNATGVAQGASFQISDDDVVNVGNPAVAMDTDGDFVIAWQGKPYDYSFYQGLYARRYNKSGVAQGNKFIVDVTEGTLGNKRNPAIAMDAVGNFVIVWDSDFEESEGASGIDIFRARFSANGTRLDNPNTNQAIQINTWSGANKFNRRASVGMDAIGNFTIVWSIESDTQPNPLDGSCDAIIARRYDSNGNAISPEFLVNAYTSGNQNNAAIAMSANGNFVVAWSSAGDCGAGLTNAQNGIYSHLYQLPTDIAISANSVPESLNDAVIGTFTSTDATLGDGHIYTLVTGAGSTDNASFKIEGNQLKTNAALNFETKVSYNTRIRSTDASGLFFEKPFTITVTNVNEAPTTITLSASSIAENNSVSALIGNLITSDPDAADTHTYALLANTADNASFKIEGNQLQANVKFDFETKSSYTIKVRSTDAAGLFVDKDFTITITNVNDPPTINQVTNLQLQLNDPQQTILLTGISSGNEANQTITITANTNNTELIVNLVVNYVSPQNQGTVTFGIAPNKSGTATITITVTDNGGGSTNTTKISFTVRVLDKPQAPTHLSAKVNDQNPQSQVDLAWRNVDNETGYRIQVSAEDDLHFTDINTGNTAADDTTYSHNQGLLPGTKYFYRVIAVNGAGDSPFSEVAGAITAAPIVTGQEDDTAETGILMYPNPTPDQLIIDLSTYTFLPVRLCAVDMYNAKGQLVWSEKWRTENKRKTIELAHLPAGKYLIVCTIGEKKTVKQIIKY